MDTSSSYIRRIKIGTIATQHSDSRHHVVDR